MNGTKSVNSQNNRIPIPLSPYPSINTESDTVFERFSYRNIQSNNNRNTNMISNDNTTNDNVTFENKKQDQPISSSTYLHKIQQRASNRQ